MAHPSQGEQFQEFPFNNSLLRSAMVAVDATTSHLLVEGSVTTTPDPVIEGYLASIDNHCGDIDLYTQQTASNTANIYSDTTSINGYVGDIKLIDLQISANTSDLVSNLNVTSISGGYDCINVAAGASVNLTNKQVIVKVSAINSGTGAILPLTGASLTHLSDFEKVILFSANGITSGEMLNNISNQSLWMAGIANRTVQNTTAVDMYWIIYTF